MKKCTNRLLAFLLSVVMVVTALPMNAKEVKADETAGQAFSVSFATTNKDTVATIGSGYYFMSNTVGENWAVHSSTASANLSDGTATSSGRVYIRNPITNSFLQIMSANNDFVLSFTADVAGYYDLTAQVTPHSKGGYADIYVNDVKVGTIDSYADGASATTGVYQPLSSVYLASGEYANTIKIVGTGKSGGSYMQTFLRSIDFEPVANPSATPEPTLAPTDAPSDSFTLDLIAATEGAYDPTTDSIGATYVQGPEFLLTKTYAGNGWRLNPDKTTLPISEEGSTVYDQAGYNSNYKAPGATVRLSTAFSIIRFNYGHTIAFDFDAATSGYYKVSILYYDNSTPEKMDVTVNGTTQRFPKQSSNTATMKNYEFPTLVELVAGSSNLLELTEAGGTFAEANIRSITFTKTDYVPPTPTPAPTATPAPTLAPTPMPADCFTLELALASQGAYDQTSGTIGPTFVHGSEFRISTTYAGNGWRLNPGKTTLPISEAGSNVYDLAGYNSYYDAPGAAIRLTSSYSIIKFNYGHTIAFDFDSPASGYYLVSIAFLDNSTPEKMDVTVNGTTQQLPRQTGNTGELVNYDFLTPVLLTEGSANLLELTEARGESYETNIQSITFTKTNYVPPTPTPVPTPKPTEDPNAVQEPFVLSALELDVNTVKTLDNKAFYFGPNTVGRNYEVHSSMKPVHLLTGTSASGCARIYLNNGTVGRYFQLYKPNADFVLSFSAPASGYYDISSTVIPHAKCGYADVYINDKYVGTLDGYIDESAEQKLLGVYLKGGVLENTIKLRATGASRPEGFYYFIFEGFSFTTPDTIATLTGIDIVADTTLMYVGDTQTVSGNGALTNGGLYRFESDGKTVTYESSNPLVASITSDGVMQALSAGTTTITVKVPELGYTETKEFTVEALAYSEPELNVEEGQFFVVGDTLTLEPKAKWNSGKYIDDTLVTTTYESTDETVAKVEDGVLYALAPGNATITAHITYDGKTLDAVRNIIVEPYRDPVPFTVTFDNVKNSVVSGSSDYLSLETTGKNWSVSDKTDAPLATGLDNLGRCRIQYGSLFPYLTLFQNAKSLVLNVYADVRGEYDITANIARSVKGGYATVHVNGEYVGTINSYADKTDLFRTSDQPLLGVYLNKGYNELSITVAGKSQGTTYQTLLKGFTFTTPEEKAKITAIDAKADVDNMYVGRSEVISVDAILSNGGFYEFSRSTETFTYVSDNTSVATVTSAGKITGVSAGTATITVTAVNSGLQDTITFDVSDAAFDKVEMNISEGENVYLTQNKELEVVATLADGTIISANDLSITYTSSDENIAKVEYGVLTPVAKGNATITANVKFLVNNTIKEDVKNIVVTTMPLQGITAETVKPVVQELDTNGVQLVVKGVLEDGTYLEDFAAAGFDSYVFTYTALTPEILNIDANGVCYYVSRGDAQVKVEALIDGVPFEQVVNVVSSSQKTGRTLYTDDMVANARNNVANYAWAQKQVAQAGGYGYEYVHCLDQVYDLIPAEGIPRSYENSTNNAPDSMKWRCPVCEVDIKQTEAKYEIDALAEPWKIMCSNCKTKFPTNDFALLYERGLDENGEYDRELAYANNAVAVARGEKDALVNELYPEKGATWMVDDGFGWSPTSGTYGTMDLIQYTPIALYMFGWWHGTDSGNITKALRQIRDYYLWTGDERFGRAGAILLDRVADLYPAYDVARVSLNYQLSHGMGYSGKIIGSITEAKEVLDVFAQCYDAFYPMYDDAEVIAYLSNKAIEKGLANPKTSGNLIRENIENGILRESFESAKESKIYGNFGLHHRSLTMVAVALDTQPETNEIFDWLLYPSVVTKTSVVDPVFGQTYSARTSNTGGGLLTTFINEIDRDGFGGEVAVSYNNMWLETADIAEILENYDTSKIDLFNNPKFVNMFDSFINLTGGGGGTHNMGYSFQFGDGGISGAGTLNAYTDSLAIGYRITRDPVLAQVYYVYNKGDFNNSKLGIYNDTKELTLAIQNDIATYGTYQLKSLNLTGYGLSIVRGGKAATKENQYETRYDTWMYYGRTNIAHAHLDMLQMGIDAYGFNFMPDLGNPEAKSYNANRYEWIRNTLSHNTVTVNESGQSIVYTGTPLHFESTDNVKVIDNECADAYNGITDIYRRSLVTIAVNDDVSYTLDFFRIKGGNKHTYSFHSQSYKHFFTEDLDLVPQVDASGAYAGTYAGVDVPYGPDPNSTDSQYSSNPVYPQGYTWLTDVNRGKDKTGDGVFTVKFEQSNWQNQVVDAAGLAMNVHALNEWEPDSIDIMVGYPPRIEDNFDIPGYDYMLIQRSGENLDTLFTTLLEPFKVDSYIQKAEPWTATIKSGTEGEDDIVKVVKVTHNNNRIDYVVYATNNEVTYTISDGNVNFDFAGFVGVYTVDYAGNNIFSYANDGTIIGDQTSVGAYTGTVVDFTKELVMDDYIVIKADQEVEDLSVFENQYIYVENPNSKCNGAFRILSAEQQGEYISLYLGNCSLIEGCIDDYNLDAGFIYTIEEGQSFRIPLSVMEGETFSGTNAIAGSAGASNVSDAATTETSASTIDDATDLITDTEIIVGGDESEDEPEDASNSENAEVKESTEGTESTEGNAGEPTVAPDETNANAGGKGARNILLGGLGVLALLAGFFLILLGKKKDKEEA